MSAAGSDKVDALEDKTPSFLWQWELRNQATLPKAHKAAGIQHKKQMQKVIVLWELAAALALMYCSTVNCLNSTVRRLYCCSIMLKFKTLQKYQVCSK